MGILRVIPGTVTDRSLRALVVGVDAGTWPIKLRALSTGFEVPIEIEQLAPSDDFGRQLGARNVRLKVAVAEGLDPATRYRLEARGTNAPAVSVIIETLPSRLPPQGLTVAVASCYYDYFHGDVAYLNALRSERWFTAPAMKWLVGDNVYVDVAHDVARYWDGYEETAVRYLRYFCDGRYTSVLGHLPTAVTWDDHELWNNYPEAQVWLARSKPGHREHYELASRGALDVLQQPLNPPPVVPGGRAYRFTVDPVSFFVADLRTAVRRAGGAALDETWLGGEDLDRLDGLLRTREFSPSAPRTPHR